MRGEAAQGVEVVSAFSKTLLSVGAILSPLSAWAVYETCRSWTDGGLSGRSPSPPWHVGASAFMAALAACAIALAAVTAAIVHDEFKSEEDES